jgi:hypothetical protein
METETWKPIPGYDGYEVSDLGRVRSWQCHATSKVVPTVPHILRPGTTTSGYLFVNLMQEGRHTNCPIHRTVLLAFVSPCPIGHEGCHWDGDRLNNRLSNLRWGTPKENAADSNRHGHHRRGSEMLSAQFTDAQVIEMRQLWAQGAQLPALGAMFHACKGTIFNVVSGHTWKHLGGPIVRHYPAGRTLSRSR